MYRNIFFIFISILSIGLNACSAGGVPSPTPVSDVKILPEPCVLKVGEQTPLSLDGELPWGNATITWNATSGSIISSPPRINAIFIAPLAPAIVAITVSIILDLHEIQAQLQCNVMPVGAPDSQPAATTVSLAGAAGVQSAAPTIAITEVMSNVCGGDDYKKYNEYVELYNYGDAPVDVRGWWLYDPGPFGTPDALIAWDEKGVNLSPGKNVVTNTTVIPSRGFAVILSTLYVKGIAPHQMPYNFPANTIILTVLDSERLGDDRYGIVGVGLEADFLILYQGGSSSIQQEISTYGNPLRGIVPNQYQDRPLDGLPLENMPECWSAKKIDPSGPDEYKNWYRLKNGSPGQASYH